MCDVSSAHDRPIVVNDDNPPDTYRISPHENFYKNSPGRPDTTTPANHPPNQPAVSSDFDAVKSPAAPKPTKNTTRTTETPSNSAG